jgi:hypothetical protein
MMPETQLHVIARQMFERHGFAAIAQAAQNALACESKGDTEQAKEWRNSGGRTSNPRSAT